MNTIKELLERPLGRKIEEIIKVNQADEQSVYSEITEYIGTDRIKDEYRGLLRAIAEAPSDPDENVGVWISGFFGSGKSSFAKNLGYMLANPTVTGYQASELFKAQLHDQTFSNLIDLVNRRIPAKVIMFDVSVDKAVKKQSQKLTDIMYTVLLRELGYAEDYDVAELEIELEAEGKLDEFIARCEEKYGEWSKIRIGAQKLSRASSLLYEIDPATYPTPNAWEQSMRNRDTDITAGKFVDRAFELCQRRCPGQALVFIIDEVGQYVARSSEKIDDLRVVIEQFGRIGKNLLKAHKIVAPTWIVVTSQEKLDEVVAALDSKRVELARVQDRFKYKVDMAPSDIREIAMRRVLAKRAEAVSVLEKLYRSSQGQLNAACRLERTARKNEVSEADFIQFYPYLPHFIELSIDIMSGIRLQPGAPRHLGGSNRTIIKQTYEMLVSERTNLKDQPIGVLVTLDRIFELVEGNLSTEKQKDLSDIRQRLNEDLMTLRVAKVISLLEFVRDLPRTEANIAACLVDRVGQPAPLAEVKRALDRLNEAQFIRNTEEGWKLQTAQEKNWDNERRSHLKPKPKDQNDIARHVLGDIFGDPKIRVHSYQGRSFKVSASVDGVRIGEDGPISLLINTSESPETFQNKLNEARDESRQKTHENDLFWVFSLTPEIDDLVAQSYASRQMVAMYERLKAQNQITNEEAASLAAEKNEILRWQNRLREKLTAAVESGQGLFRGRTKDAATLGQNLTDIFRALYNFAMPDMYPKLGMAARSLKGTEAEDILKAANLNGLPQVFYQGDQGLNLVIKDGTKYIPNPSAEVAKEVLDYLVKENEYGNKDTRQGKAIEAHFGGAPYGWERDVLRVILASLFRAGAIEVTHGGRRFDTYQDAQSREAFVNNPAFRSAVFTPTRPINLQTLTRAVKSFEDITGDTVDVDKNAIAGALKAMADVDMRILLPLQAKADAHKLPVLAQINEYGETLERIQNETADGCVAILAGEGNTLKAARERIRRINGAIDDDGLAQVRWAQVVIEDIWPILAERGQNGDLTAAAEELQMLLTSETYYQSMAEIKIRAEAISNAYNEVYVELHHKRFETFSKALDAIKGLPDWMKVPEEMQSSILLQLTRRACETPQSEGKAITCTHCSATLIQMDSDLAAVGSLKEAAIQRVRELTTPPEEVQYIRLADYFPPSIEALEQFEDAYQSLREQLSQYLADEIKIVFI